uniref:Uncharacterized protein isoform X2 n=1 Tax=Nicotiana tabacum TaxID=4097 RepID=A0A1S3Y7L3_TOBAC|nr:uncharacterized protein LOC104091777 isoform X5 [Nicotiana tomentosiformis]XP_016447987.1 PREDICTED: uncharacterized protein LOC107773037 isoform X2 [Nicotiana tabacum]
MPAFMILFRGFNQQMPSLSSRTSENHGFTGQSPGATRYTIFHITRTWWLYNIDMPGLEWWFLEEHSYLWTLCQRYYLATGIMCATQNIFAQGGNLHNHYYPESAGWRSNKVEVRE